MRAFLSHKNNHGFTLIEMTLVIVLLGIFSKIGVNMITDSFSTTRIVNNGYAVTSSSRYAMDRLSREIRQAAFDISTQSPKISTASDSLLSFTKSNLSAEESISIYLNGQQSLMLNNATLGSDAILAEHVTIFSLQYYDSNMVTTAIISQIRFIKINFKMSEAGAEPVELHTMVALRNS